MRERKHFMEVGGSCVCPNCGEKTAHQKRVTCNEEKCPKCGTTMLREGSEHHRIIQEKKAEKTDTGKF